ncbi:MAG: DUF547 domain-containing protein [Kangiellaceae bacterium]|nr:DUF547 domain-containing protein [Kangiellaceae bacterium]
MNNIKTQSGVALLTTVVSFTLLLALAIFLFWKWNTQAILISHTIELPENFPKDSFSHESFAQLLARFVNRNGNVNYNKWLQDKLAVKQLDQYLAAVAKYSPDSSNRRFPHKNDRLGYWVYSYNAQVIRSILSNWPLSSVTDLKAPVEIIQGLGFFYNRKFVFGGRALSLYQVENGKIFDGQGDPRVHFILNCGSGSCPVLRPQLPLGDDLEPFLKNAAWGFIEDTKNLKFDHENNILYLSTIFKWYKSDFTNAVKAKKENPTLVDYLISVSRESFVDELKKSKNYSIKFTTYDWSLNQVER